MSRFAKLIVLLVSLAGWGLWGGNALAATFTSVAAGGAWATAATWNLGAGPAPTGAATDVVVIASTGPVTIGATVTQAAGATVTVNSGATLTATAAGTVTFGALTIASGGTFTVSRVLTVRVDTNITGTINLSGGRANVFIGNVTLNSGAVWNETAANTPTFSGDFTNNATTFTASTGTYTFNGAGHILSGATTTSIPSVAITGTYTNSGTLTVGTALSGTGGLTQGTTGTLNLGGTTTITTLVASAAGNTVNYNGAAQTVDTPAPATYYNLTLSGSNTKTMPATAMTVAGNFTLSSTATATTRQALTVGGNLDVGAGTTLTVGAFNIGVTGTTSVSGILAHSSATGTKTYTGAVTINALGAWTNAGNAPIFFRGGLTHNGATFTAGTGLYTFDTNSQAIGGSSTIAIPSLTVGAAVTLTNNGTLTVSTALAGTTLANVGTLNISFAAVPGITTLTAAAVGNTVNYTGAAQTVKATTYYHLGLSGSGAKTLTNVSTVNGNLTLSGTATATTAIAFSIGGNLTVGTGTTFTSANFTNSVTGTTSVTGTLAHSGVAAKTYIGAVTINALGAWTNAGNAPIFFRGGLTHNGATFTAGTGLYTFDTNSQAIGGSSAIAIPSLTVTGAAVTLTNNGTLTVATALSGNGGLTNSAAGVLNIGGASVITTLTAIAVGNTVNYTGALAQTINATTYDILTASGAGTKTISAATTVNATMSVSGAVTNNSTLTVTGALSGAGALTNSATGVLNIGGTSGINTLTATAVGNTVNYTGGAAQTISVTTYHHLGISGGDKTLGGAMTANGVLTLTSGTITTGVNTLTLAASCPGSYSRSSGYVIGNLRLTFPGGNSTCIYHVGDSIGYAPITVDMVGATAGTLTGRSDSGDHPDTISSSSGIDSTKSANHYWTLTAGTLTTYTSYSATFQFCANTGSCVIPTEVDTGATTSNFIVARKISGTWSTPTVGTKNSYSTQATGITSANGFGAFAVGEVNLCFADSLSGVDGSAPGANWSVGFKTGTFGNPVIFGNRLRLTDATTGAATWATLQRLFPAAGNKITVEFEHFAYGGTATGADGIAVVFSDASMSPTAGAFGGSLGYAQKCENGVAGCVSDCLVVGGCPGFIGGWLGIALDEYGNFSTNIEGRFGGGTSRVPESASIRGSGSGVSGYRFIQGTTTQSPAIDGDNVPPGPFVHRYRIIIDHTDPGGHAYVSVERDTTSGAGTAYTRLIAPFDIKDPGYSQSAIPTGFNVSFTGSTGSSTNIHEIRNLNICTAQGLAAPTLHHIEIDHDGSACTSGTETVTVKACANDLCTSLYGGSVTVDLTPSASGARTWAPTEPVTFTGGSVALTLANTAAGTVTLGGTATSPTTGNPTRCFNGLLETCFVVFSVCTFDALEVSLPTTNRVIYTKLANTAFDLSVLSLSGTNQTASIVELVNASSGTCSAFPSLGNASTPVLPSVFTGNQRKTFSFTYNNAAPNVQVRVTNSASVVSCSSDNFAIRPQAYTVTSSASQSGSSGSPVFRAGTDPFSLTATAVYGATTTSGYTGIPRLNSSLISTDQAHLGNISATTFPAAISGVSTAIELKYDEVGNFRLAQHAVYDDTFATVDSVKGECTTGFNNIVDGSGKFSCQFGLEVPVGPFGRFVPDHFTVMSTVSNACATGTFTYMAQPFPLTANMVESRNAANGVTQNYVAPYAPGSVSFGAENADNGTDLSLRLSFPSGSWATGVYTLTGTSASFSRLTTPDGSFEALDIGLTVTDSDVSTVPRVSDADMNPSTAGGSSFTYKKFSGSPLRMRFGILKLDNAYGSELLPIRVPLQAMYWDGGRFILNTDDSCTQLSTTNVAIGNYKSPLASAILCGFATAAAPYTGTCNGTPATTTLSGGSANLVWSSGRVIGSADVAINLGATSADANCIGAGFPVATAGANLSWLHGNWCGGTFVKDPNARIKFGSAKSPFIYLRERY